MRRHGTHQGKKAAAQAKRLAPPKKPAADSVASAPKDPWFNDKDLKKALLKIKRQRTPLARQGLFNPEDIVDSVLRTVKNLRSFPPPKYTQDMSVQESNTPTATVKHK